MILSGYMNAPTEPSFLALKNLMEYLIHNPNEPIMYSINNIFKLNEIPHQCFFKAGSAEIKKISNTPNFFTYNATWIM